MQVRIAWKP